ncbi:hypothetical protein CQS04_08230 [Chryseomicrobium excrementi]|uniref:Uncharacterized protein n=2 Tax=Chryseomicrobium excrementi TaxID=2041346 RepID=A0A2M9F0Z4_9BACL|nr:hypothetical protein CQS04_08230 [Chryseomicrobium excrementi]
MYMSFIAEGNLSMISKRTKISLALVGGLVAVVSLTQPFLFLFITLPLVLITIGYIVARKVQAKVPPGWLSLLLSVIAGGVAVFLSAIVLYTLVEMGYNGKSNAELDRFYVLESAARTAQNVTVFLAFLLSYLNFIAFLDRRREVKKKEKTLS